MSLMNITELWAVSRQAHEEIKNNKENIEYLKQLTLWGTLQRVFWLDWIFGLAVASFFGLVAFSAWVSPEHGRPSPAARAAKFDADHLWRVAQYHFHQFGQLPGLVQALIVAAFLFLLIRQGLRREVAGGEK